MIDWILAWFDNRFPRKAKPATGIFSNLVWNHQWSYDGQHYMVYTDRTLVGVFEIYGPDLGDENDLWGLSCPVINGKCLRPYEVYPSLSRAKETALEIYREAMIKRIVHDRA